MKAFYLGAGLGSGILKVLVSFEKSLGKRIPIKKVGRRNGDIPQGYKSVEKAEFLLGWSAKKNINGMYISAQKFYKNRDEK